MSTIPQLIKKLQTLKTIKNKILKLLDEKGVEIAKLNYSQATSDYGNDVVITSDIKDNTLTIYASGTQVLFIEFGAGIKFNGEGSPHPKGEDLGYTIGSYNKVALTGNAWGGKDIAGNKIITYGNVASLALYNTIETLRNELHSIVKEVLSK